MQAHDHLTAKEKAVIVAAWIVTALVFAGWILLTISVVLRASS
jgi:hypothetical protein